MHDLALRPLQHLPEVRRQEVFGLWNEVLYCVHNVACVVLDHETLVVVQLHIDFPFLCLCCANRHQLSLCADMEVLTPVLLQLLAHDAHQGRSVLTCGRLDCVGHEGDDARLARLHFPNEELDTCEVVWWLEVIQRDSLSFIGLDFLVEHTLVEKVLDPLIRQIDEKLFERVDWHIFKTKNVQQSYPVGTMYSFLAAHLVIHHRNNPVKQF
mmetsp:Transcript_70993/g.179087  ORF Transcript_70993/g.179087 Transcript_70993/m.179087 type:complete len:211 (-) Transcript_70993:1345-1977(-)